MAEHGNEWDYCDIRYQIRYKGEDTARAGLRLMWLVFQASASGSNRGYLAAESIEIPVAANVIGVSFEPQEHNPVHFNAHQDLLHQLQEGGWERLSGQGEAWWEARLRRPASRHESRIGWFKRIRNWLSQARSA